MSPYKKNTGGGSRSPSGNRTLKEFFLFLFLTDSPYGLCQSHSSSLELFPTVKFKHPAHSFLWNASGCQLSKTVLESPELSNNCANQQGEGHWGKAPQLSSAQNPSPCTDDPLTLISLLTTITKSEGRGWEYIQELPSRVLRSQSPWGLQEQLFLSDRAKGMYKEGKKKCVSCFGISTWSVAKAL